MNIVNFIQKLHPFFTIILLAIYVALIIKLRNKEKSSKIDRVLAQCARIFLLLVYISGIWLSVRMQIFVHPLHHLFSIFPIIIIFFFQYTSIGTQKKTSLKNYVWMFIAMFIAVLIAAFTARLGIMPAF